MAAVKKKAKSSKGTSKPSAARKRAASSVSLPDALAEAAWAEADLALAEALADLDEAETAATAAARADALALLSQSLSRAARKRGLTRIGALDEKAAFNPSEHDLAAAGAKKPKKVRISARGVARGGDVLVRTRVRAEPGASKPRKTKR
jgi:hypothetical protein